MKTPEAASDERKVQRRQQFLKKLQDERLAGAGAPLRSALDEKSQLARRREEPAGETARALLREKHPSAQQSAAAQARRDEELKAASLLQQKTEEEAELRAAKLREERRNAQLSAAAQTQRDEELKTGWLRKQQEEQQAEARAARLHEDQRNARQSAALQKQEEERRAEIRAARVREERRIAQQNAAAQAQRDQELRTAALQKQEAEQEAESRAAELREEERNALQSEASRTQRDEESKADALRKQEGEQRAETSAAKLREEQRNAQGEQIRRDEELLAAAVQFAETQRQEQQQQEVSQVRAAAKRPAAQRRARMALRASARQRMGAAFKPGDEVTPGPSSSQFFNLNTSASLLVDENNKPVSLRGVTVRGLDSVAPAPGQSFPAALALDTSSLLEMTSGWGVNLVRLPFQAHTILSGNGSVAVGAMLAGLDATVAAITEAGAYVLLALEPPPGSGAPPAPDASTTQAWQTLAARYQTEPRVLFEIFASASALPANWLQSASTLATTIRALNSASVIFLGSGRGGADVTGLPLLSPSGDPFSNVVYTIAVSNTSLLDPSDGQLGGLAQSYPVFASMWSDDGTDLWRSSGHAADLFERCGIGWAAANWNAAPLLVADAANDDFTPTGWGVVAQRALAMSAVDAYQPASATSQSIFTTHGPALHELKTSGSFLVDENNNPVNLRGVTVQGLDTIAPASGQTFPAALALDDDNLLELCERWHANLVRLPFQAQTILTGNSALTVAAMLAGLDATVAAITEAGAYVLFALQAPAGSGAPVAPDAQAAQVWQVLAERYQKTSGVLFEIFSSTAPLANWLQSAGTLVATIRQRKPAALIFMSSGNGGSNVSGLPLLLPTGVPMSNFVYTIAVSAESIPDPNDGQLSALAKSSPVFASLWSDDGSDFGRSLGARSGLVRSLRNRICGFKLECGSPSGWRCGRT